MGRYSARVRAPYVFCLFLGSVDYAPGGPTRTGPGGTEPCSRVYIGLLERKGKGREGEKNGMTCDVFPDKWVLRVWLDRCLHRRHC